MGSTRLPGKTLMKFNGISSLEYLIKRINKSKYVKNVIVNTSQNQIDDKIIQFCIKRKILFCRGSEKDVLRRMVKVIKKFNLKNFINIYGDSILNDPRIINKASKKFISFKNFDFVGNDLRTTYPPGFEVEVIKSKALLKSDKICKNKNIREHGTLFIRLNPHLFKLHNFEYKNRFDFLPELTLDTKEDFQIIKEIINNFHVKKKSDFDLNDIMEFLCNNRSFLNINSHIERRWKKYRLK